jgi:hypothetical protein
MDRENGIPLHPKIGFEFMQRINTYFFSNGRHLGGRFFYPGTK